MLHNHTGYILTDTSLQVLEMGLAALRATGEESCRLPLEGYASGSRTLTQFDATLTSAGLARRTSSQCRCTLEREYADCPVRNLHK